MLDILLSLMETVTTLISFVVTMITSLFTLIANIPRYLTLLINSLNVLPVFVIPWAVVFVSLVVVQYLLNRRAQ